MKVGAFGSCRVWTPLRLAAEAAKLAYAQERTFGFLHNAVEIAQAIRILKGELSVDPALNRLVSVMGRTNHLGRCDLFEPSYADVDAFVVEISSLRLICYRGWTLQIQQFAKRFRVPQRPSLAVAAYQRVGQWPLAIEDLLKSDQYSAEDRAVLAETTLREQRADELLRSLHVITELLARPILFVGHTVLDRRGNPIQLRKTIRDTLAAFTAGRDDLDFFDPTPHVEAAGKDRALIDLGHYQPWFETLIADHLATRLSDLVRRSRCDEISGDLYPGPIGQSYAVTRQPLQMAVSAA